MTKYMPRSKWTASSASGDALTGDKLKGVAFHWPGTSENVIGDEGTKKTAARLRGYRNYHKSRTWRDIGYTLAADQGGRLWMLRSSSWRGNMVGAHCASPANRDANEEYVGVLLILGDEEKPSDAMIDAVRDWYHNKFLAGWPDRDDVRVHGDVYGAQTTCAGPYVRAALDELIATPGSGGGDPEPDPEPPSWDGESFPGRDAFRLGEQHDATVLLDKRLIAHDYTRYNDGDGYQPGPTYTRFTRENVREFQEAQGWTGDDADGFPGPVTWERLMADAPEHDVVDLSRLREAARNDPPRDDQDVTYAQAKIVEQALVKERLLRPRYADGHFGRMTIRAYSRWQRRCGFRGHDADGLPGWTSLNKLGDKYDFRVRE